MGDFGEALATWMNVIVGDLEEIPSSLLPEASTCTQYPETIDDLYICGASNSIDGPGGTLGFARPLFRRSASLLPITGYVASGLRETIGTNPLHSKLLTTSFFSIPKRDGFRFCRY
jgi:hypothetical protein